MIAALVTLTAKDTGYSLFDLITAVYVANSWPTASIPLRVASVTVLHLTSAGAWIVPRKGAYANTSHVPNQYGWDFNQGGTEWEKFVPYNVISLEEIVLGTDTDGDTFAVLAFTV